MNPLHRTRFGFLLTLALCLGMLAGPVWAKDQWQAPPPALTGIRLMQRLIPLQQKGLFVSLNYQDGLYRIELLTPQGLILRYQLDPVSGMLTARRGSDIRRKLVPAGLMPLGRLLQSIFGQREIQLLTARFKLQDGLPVYELHWLEQGRLFLSRFDAGNACRLGPD